MEELKIDEVSAKEGNALVIKNALFYLDNPSYKSKIESLGLNVDFFNSLLRGEYKNWKDIPVEMDYPPSEPVEHIIIRSAKTPDEKKVEVTEVAAYAPHTMKTRLKKPENESVGFEAIFLQKGSISHSLLPEINPVAAGVYTGAKEPFEITLEPGDLLLIPRPIARQISKVTKDTEYLYIGDPWVEGDMPVEIL